MCNKCFKINCPYTLQFLPQFSPHLQLQQQQVDRENLNLSNVIMKTELSQSKIVERNK